MENMKMDKKETKEVVLTHIRARLNYSQTKKELEKAGIDYPALKTSFYKWRQEIFPETARQDALTELKEQKDKKTQKTPQRPAWNKTKQTEADTSVFADVMNEALFHFIPCPHKGLTVEDVKQINVGGSVVGLVTFYTNINLNHPVIVFVTRTIMLVLKVRKMCFMINEKIEAAKESARSVLPAIGGMQKTR